MLKKIPLVVYALIPILLFLYFVFSSEGKNLQDIVNDATQEPSIEESFPSPTLDSIFAEDHSFIATISAGRIRTMIATGDVIPARVVNVQATQRNDFLWPFRETVDVLKSADVTFINLEAPLIQDCPLKSTGFTFCGDQRHIEGLAFAGVDVANIANNHIANYGQIGIDQTVSLLKSRSIDVTGLGETTIRDVRGMKFAFLGYDDLKRTGPITDEYKAKIRQDIREAARVAQVVVVQFHWGVEYVTQPTKDQIELGYLAIDSGADVVIGNHPHWIQPVEVYKNKVIMYAHGNFIFDQMWSQKTREGVVGRYTFYDDKIIDVEFIPIEIIEYGQATLLEKTRKQQILEQMKNSSKTLSTNL